MSRHRQLTILSVFAVVGLWLLWLYVVLREIKAEQSLFGIQGSEIGKLGQFGDSFGVLASLMTALAASAAISAFMSQQIDGRIHEFERHFYAILGNIQTMIAEIDVTRMKDVASLANKLKEDGLSIEQRALELRVQRPFMEIKGSVKGRDALRYLLDRLRKRIGDRRRFQDSKQIAMEYEIFFRKWQDDIGHYFRSIYHLFKLIDEECPSDPNKYARIARAHFSNSELILIAYNCSVGIGRFKFKKYINKYSIIHNIKPSAKMLFYRSEIEFFKNHFGDVAFKNDGEDAPYSYDDVNNFRT